MAKSSASELFTTLKGYINQLSEGERTPAEIGSALNDWARESAESIKVKVSEEVESTVARMGFIKREEYDLLLQRVDALEKQLTKVAGESSSSSTSSSTKSSVRKKAVSKLVPKKRSAIKKDA